METKYITKCLKCDADLDIEDRIIDNICPYCGTTQKHNKEDLY